jgi:CheY-like chemotaxis protein
MLDAGIQHEDGTLLNGKETVLVVDDNEGVRFFLNDALPVFGYSVICAEDGLDGLNKFREHKDKIHVALLDIVMPKLNGIELFKRIKNSEPNTKVLFMSGYNDILDRSNQHNEIKCISKPFKINTLLKELREVLDKS